MKIPARFATPLLAVPCLLAWPDAAGADSIIDGDWKETAAPGYGECPAPEQASPE